MGKRITRVKVNCSQCDKEIEREKNQYDKNTNKRFFCSYKCQFRWRYENTSFPKNKGILETANRIIVKCNFCGKEKSIFMSTYKKNKNKIFYCNTKCQYNGYRNGSSPSFKGGKITKPCLVCGSLVEDWPSQFRDRVFCSKICSSKWISENLSGENNSLWNSILVQCGWCDKDKYVHPHQIENSKTGLFFCSQECNSRWQSENRKGENCPAWKGGPVVINCSYCGKEKEIRTGHFNNDNIENYFCDINCRGKFYSLEKNPNWNGGISFLPYGPEFNYNLRERIRNRDFRRCFMCSEIEHRNGRKHSVHHIDYNKENNLENNLISLCSSCHLETNYNREYWQKYFEDVMRKRYNTSEDFDENKYQIL